MHSLPDIETFETSLIGSKRCFLFSDSLPVFWLRCQVITQEKKQKSGVASTRLFCLGKRYGDLLPTATNRNCNGSKPEAEQSKCSRLWNRRKSAAEAKRLARAII